MSKHLATVSRKNVVKCQKPGAEPDSWWATICQDLNDFPSLNQLQKDQDHCLIVYQVIMMILIIVDNNK